jgi:thiol-disulfide isomerase/thioredoxin
MRHNGKQAIGLSIALVAILPLVASFYLVSKFQSARAAEPAAAGKATESETKSPSPPDTSIRDMQLAEYARYRRLMMVKPGDPAPEWLVVGWTDGQQRTLKSFRGKIVVLDFWGVWCAPCLQALPIVEELQRKYRDRDVVFLGIHSAGTSMDEVKKTLEKHGSTLVTGLDTGSELEEGGTVKVYRPFGWPTTVVIGADGY